MRGREPRVFLMAGGGTGGHVIPALAVAGELRARGHAVFFMGTERGVEARLVPLAGFELVCIRIGGLKSVGAGRVARTLWQLPAGVCRAARQIRRRRVAAVFSMGGYAAGPPVLAALLLRRPVVVMEPNVVPGFTNRHIGRFVERALISFPETAAHFPPGRTELAGLPVREEFFRIQDKPRGEEFTVLITGGSQGSRTLNEAARASWPLLRASGLRVRLLHQSGARDAAALGEAFASSGLAGEVTPFIADMPRAFAEADLVVCRAGAGALAELAAAGKPAVLVPFPFAADQHQLKNAAAMARAGAARLVPDAEMNGETLFAVVREMAGAPQPLAEMGAAARRLARPGAAARAASVLEEVGGTS